jgi:hypothetical protein
MWNWHANVQCVDRLGTDQQHHLGHQATLLLGDQKNTAMRLRRLSFVIIRQALGPCVPIPAIDPSHLQLRGLECATSHPRG